MESDKKKSRVKPKHPRAGANPISALFFGWTLPLFLKSMKKDFEEEDLFEPLNEHKASLLGDKFERIWLQEVERCKNSNSHPRFAKVIIKVFGFQLFIYGLIVLTTDLIVSIGQPLLLGGLLDHFSSGGSLKDAYLYAAGVVFCSGVSVLVHSYMMGMMHIGMKVRVAASSLIYRKALKLSKYALGQTTVGQLVNLLSNDVNRFDFTFIFFHILWIGPLETVIITYFVWKLIGPASLIGLVSILLFIPLQAWLGKQISTLRLKTALRTDERIRLMNEIISGIQVIKMYTWEKPFANLVSNARRKELNVITKSSYCQGIMLSFVMFHTRTSIFLSILAYLLFGNTVITAQKVFVVTSFYNSLRQIMTIYFPLGMASIAECLVSIKRIQEFLLCDETKGVDSIESPAKPFIHLGEGEIRDPMITVTNGSAKWNVDHSENTLTDINLNIVPSKLTAIMGPVGAGKSSLLHVILKELELSEGNLSLNGSISYASQEPWLFVGSVRQNILFGQPYNKGRYRQVVRACALTTDFEQLPFGDKSLIGERGISLSGGQKARVNLARAIYKEADIYLLDDPLSAVDAHVGKHLFDDCISDFLKGKTVILITHQLQYLNNVDHIILLENGCVSAEGTFNDLLNKKLDFTKLLLGSDNETNLSRLRKSSISSESSMEEIQRVEPPEDSEAVIKGTVKKGVYWTYLTAGGGILSFMFAILLFILAQIFATGGDYWLSFWVNLEQYGFSHSLIKNRETCIYIFAGLTVGTIAFTLLRSFVFFIMCMKISKKLHDNMFYSITRATMRFFHTNSSGRILNRFSNDVGSIDGLLPTSLADVFQIGFGLIGVIVVVVAMNPWLLIPTFIAAIIFYYLQTVYLLTSRCIKRLEMTSRSPILTHLTASLQGLTTIRAYKIQELLQNEFDNHQDLHSTAWYLYLATNRSFGLWLDMVCLVYIALVTFSFLIILPGSYSGAVGLAITQSIGLVSQFQWGMRQSAELESNMTSVERVLEYSNLFSEPPLKSSGKNPPENWPDRGEIKFEQVSLRYSPHDSWVLKNLSFTIAPQQKVGIVGRTGAGKSSLIAALFRLSETEGCIKLDGVETKSVGLHDLRSKISIIPQEPVLFSGSLRKNLDPFKQFSDEILWSALEEVKLKEAVTELPEGLSAKMAEGGSNFSVGQRQLLCLARAIIRNNKILVLDEATANVDPQTDALIQKTIRQKFANCTVLTIAHRLITVMDSEKLLVMDGGHLVDFDHPHLLIKNNSSIFANLVEKSNKSNIDLLKNIAFESYQELLKRS